MNHHGGGGAGVTLLAVVLACCVAGGYAVALVRLRGRGDGWPVARVAAAAVAVGALVAVAALGAAGDFPTHVVRHLLLAMAAPAALTFAAPLTLALRTLPSPGRRALLGLLHSPGARLVTSGPVVLLLEVGGMAAFYLTPLWGASHQHVGLDVAVHTHMFLAGWLFAGYVAGADPGPVPRGVRGPVVVLLLAAGSHEVLAKLLYARGLPGEGGADSAARVGAQVMAYGGDVVEIVLAVVLMAGWYARTGRALRHAARRERAAA